MKRPQLAVWQKLITQAESMRSLTIKTLHYNHNQASEQSQDFLNKQCKAITLDLSQQCIDSDTLALLITLAHECQLPEKINALFTGKFVNTSEQRPALHTALRLASPEPILVNGHDIVRDIFNVREDICLIVEKITQQQWLGYSGKAITDIVNIGIGGSDLGPRFCLDALKDYANPCFGYYFISDVDPEAFYQATKTLNPETTLFIVSSKSFTTTETLYNAKKAMAWINHPQSMDKHFIAVTANINQAHTLGFTHVLPVWDFIGGRYSFCSAINLITAIAVGFEGYLELLAGAHAMDNHFKHTPFKDNLPVLLALVGLWNNNFLNIHQLLMLTYGQKLAFLMPYIQQLDMESNGKSVDKDGNTIDYATGPIIWGGPGNQAQHSYYQLLCQGTHRVAVDFVSVDSFDGELINQMCNNKKRVLSQGITDLVDPIYFIAGNQPLNHIKLQACMPFAIGQLIALYEHKIYTQAVIWDINPFDQPGVESAKKQSGLV